MFWAIWLAWRALPTPADREASVFNKKKQYQSSEIRLKTFEDVLNSTECKSPDVPLACLQTIQKLRQAANLNWLKLYADSGR